MGKNRIQKSEGRVAQSALPAYVITKIIHLNSAENNTNYMVEAGKIAGWRDDRKNNPK